MPKFPEAVPAIHGADKHTSVERYLWLPANEGFVQAGTPKAENKYAMVEGGANLDEPIVYFTIKVPDDFVSFGSVKAIWAAWAAAGNMYWKLDADYGPPGWSISNNTDYPGSGVTANAGMLICNEQEPANPLTLVNLALGDVLGIEFRRSGSDDLDTINTALEFYGLLFTYVASQ